MAGLTHRHVAAWLAILGLYVQLVAVGFGTCCLPISGDAAPSPFPICHAQSNDQGSTQTPGDPASAHHHECAFCLVHCHAAMAFAPSMDALASVYAISTAAEQVPFIIPVAARFSAGAPPRGPPASA